MDGVTDAVRGGERAGEARVLDVGTVLVDGAGGVGQDDDAADAEPRIRKHTNGALTWVWTKLNFTLQRSCRRPSLIDPCSRSRSDRFRSGHSTWKLSVFDYADFFLQCSCCFTPTGWRCWCRARF